jgi:hypothetical protein
VIVEMAKLLEGKWEADDGRIFTIPSFTRDNGAPDALVRTAKHQASERGLKVVKVWAVYIYKKEIYHA